MRKLKQEKRTSAKVVAPSWRTNVTRRTLPMRAHARERHPRGMLTADWSPSEAWTSLGPWSPSTIRHRLLDISESAPRLQPSAVVSRSTTAWRGGGPRRLVFDDAQTGRFLPRMLEAILNKTGDSHCNSFVSLPACPPPSLPSVLGNSPRLHLSRDARAPSSASRA